MTEVTLAEVENKCCTKNVAMCKKDGRSPHWKSRFFIVRKGVGLSLYT